MNKAKELKNWRRGGNHYVLRATSDNKWVGLPCLLLSVPQADPPGIQWQNTNLGLRSAHISTRPN